MSQHNSNIDKFIKCFSEILSQNTLPFGLKIDEANSNYYPIYFNKLRRGLVYIDSKAKLKFGMSKCVITAPSLNNIVIKIPFSGTYNYCYEDFKNKKIKSVDYIDERGNPYNFIPFKISDYCESEYKKYCALKKKELECFVAKTAFYTTLNNGIKIFLQEKIIPNQDRDWNSDRPSKKSMKIVNDWTSNEYVFIDNNWLALCIDRYGEYKTRKFINYCKKEDPDIDDDLHSANIGVRVTNASPAILDFSGFFEN